MIHIISGGIDVGKTQRMEAIYRKLKRGDGWVSKKIYSGTAIAGYELVRLSTGESMPLAYKAEYIPLGWEEKYRCGPFSFSRAAFEYAGRVMGEIIDSGVEPVFIDEIGPLELRGEGFGQILRKVLQTGREVYLAIRSHCVDAVLKEFGIREHKIWL